MNNWKVSFGYRVCWKSKKISSYTAVETVNLYNHGYERLIPRRYWSRSTASKHRFEIVEPWWSPFEIVQLQTGGLASIAPSAYCQVLIGDSYISVLIPLSKYPVVGWAVTQFGKVLFTGARNEKYMTLFKVYETICSKPDIKFAALRHALAHSTVVLNRPNTVAALVSMFGKVNVNLSDYRHQNIFWLTFSDLLVEVDRLLAAELRSLDSNIQMPKAYKQPLTLSVAGYYFPTELSALLTNRLLINSNFS